MNGGTIMEPQSTRRSMEVNYVSIQTPNKLISRAGKITQQLPHFYGKN